jgi:NTP pyrophosphatase (non-canonical NTP hydrolase)
MTPNEYQNLAARTLSNETIKLSNHQLRILWNAIGVAGEAGEIAELAKKGIFHKHGIDANEWEKEIGDVLWYLAALCSVLGLDLEDVMIRNIEKLKARYPDGWDIARTKFRDGVAA